MPHVIVSSIRVYRRVKSKLAEEVARAVMSTLNTGEQAVSVGIEDVKPEHWVETVY